MKAIVAGNDPGTLGVKDMSAVSAEVLELCSTTSNTSTDASDKMSTSLAPDKQPVIQQNGPIVTSPEVEKGPPPNVVSQ